jgi:succinyl-diaminopimelate desuccinylase
VLDSGNDWFQASNIEVTDIFTGNPATNVIPGNARARLSVRFNDEQNGLDLIARIEAIVHRHAPAAQVKGTVYGEAFLTQPGALSALVAGAIEARLGVSPELSTSGGTSDARYLVKLCPVVEFGLINATMHKLDEAVALADLLALADVYEEVLRRVRA